MKILGIETSCDETAVAIVTDKKKILSNLIFSQIDEHALYGGVVPEVAARSHMEHIKTLTKKALSEAGLSSFKELDAIAVTAGPGLIGGVMVGVMMAKAIAAVHSLPIYAINHLEGHALMPRMTNDIEFPYLLLLASGGHSQILAVKAVGDYICLGTTKDDAMGECFDKVAKLLGLGYPGGPAVEKLAAKSTNVKTAIEKFNLPKPLFGREGCDFSFSGLKTAMRKKIEALKSDANGDILDIDKIELLAAFQGTVGLVIKNRIENAIKEFRTIFPNVENPNLVVSGGVAANEYLRQVMQNTANENNFKFAAPPINLCTDNGVMIAWAGVERMGANMSADNLDFNVAPRWPLDNM